MNATRFIPVLILLGAFSMGAVALADQNSPVRHLHDDTVTEHDRSEYARERITERFGIEFHTHTRVCTEAADGEVHCDARVVSDASGAPLAAAQAIIGFGPAQLRSAYGVTGIAPASANPQIIAIVDAYDHPNIQNDLATYSAAFGIPSLPACLGAIANATAPCFKKVDQRGGTRYPRGNSGWALEIALDVEAAHALCQNCSILLVEADSSSYTSLMSAVDRAVALGAKIVSNSYGSSEFSSETSYDYHFNKPGVAFTVSSGDAGYGTEYPASSRYVTAVGGTSLFLNSDGSYNTELAWSGAGSGCSQYEGKASWQTDLLCADHRTVADVSAVADPNTGAAVYDSVSYAGKRGWFQVGGTSLAAPVIAGMYALSGTTTGAANQIPYVQGNASNVHDIVGGSNGSCGGTYLCTALAGFDGPTGLGSPKGILAF